MSFVDFFCFFDLVLISDLDLSWLNVFSAWKCVFYFVHSDSSDTTSTTIVLKGRARDYDTGAESADELDDADYDR